MLIFLSTNFYKQIIGKISKKKRRFEDIETGLIFKLKVYYSNGVNLYSLKVKTFHLKNRKLGRLRNALNPFFSKNFSRMSFYSYKIGV